MAYEVSIAENIEWLEVYSEEVFDQPRIDPWQIEEFLKNKVQQEFKEILEAELEWETDQQLRAIKYERGVMERRDYRNGYRERSLSTTMGTVELRVPRARKGLSFQVFQAYKRRWGELDQLLLEAYIGGMSCRGVGKRIARLLGCELSGTTIGKLIKELEESLKRFRNEPLNDEYVALVLDGMYVRIKQCGERKRPVVAVVGIKADGRKQLLAFRVCYSENSTEVEGISRNLKERGLRGANLQTVTLDGNKGLESAVYAVYGNVRIQDCIFHRINRLHRNAKGKNRGRKMMQEASEAFDKQDVREQRKTLKRFCEKWREKESKAVQCFEHKLERCFEVNILPRPLRKLASTTSLCENLFHQIRDRIDTVGAFETPRAVELFVFAIVCQKKWIGIPGRTPAAPLLNESTHFP